MLKSWLWFFAVSDFLESSIPIEYHSLNSLFYNKCVKKLGLIKKRTLPYHPQCNRLLEISNTTIRIILRKVNEETENFLKNLPISIYTISQLILRTRFLNSKLSLVENVEIYLQMKIFEALNLIMPC